MELVTSPRNDHVVVGVDVGGTFTDLAAVVDGRLVVAKVPSTPSDQSAGVADALAAAAVAGPVVLSHGMTVATNALLERRGARTAIVTTEGFADLVEIARQDRASVYDLSVRRPVPLVPRELRFVVRERVSAQGVLVPLDEASVQAVIEQLVAAQVEAVAVCFLFSFLHSGHEQAVGRALRAALPHVHVSLSCEVLPEFREYERLSTTVANAFLAPEMARYLGRLSERVQPLGVEAIHIMQSSGGVRAVEGAGERPAALVLSGPAGGLVGAQHVARLAGCDDVLTLDIGGTSADVAAISSGRAVTATARRVAGIEIALPALDIHTISAGGGSLVWSDEGGALRVGPRSAGAVPGPAAYGQGGMQPAATDAQVALGRLADGARLGGSVVLSRAAAEQALAPVGETMGLSVTEVALGAIAVMDAALAQAVRQISVARGLDPRRFALLAFGGAGGLHACAVADELGIDRVIVPAAGGVLSALGLAVSDLRTDASASFRSPLLGIEATELEACFQRLTDTVTAELDDAVLTRRLDLRYRGQSFELTLDLEPWPTLAERFHSEHERRFGHADPDEPVEVVCARVEARRGGPGGVVQLDETGGTARRGRVGTRTIVLGSGPVEAEIWTGVPTGAVVPGPAMIEEASCTTLVAPGWRAASVAPGVVMLTKEAV